jgi:hypothetical protein
MVDYGKQEEAQEIAMLTRKLSACSASPKVDEVGSTTMNSDGYCERGTW